jgi:hypothetical protein
MESRTAALGLVGHDLQSLGWTLNSTLGWWGLSSNTNRCPARSRLRWLPPVGERSIVLREAWRGASFRSSSNVRPRGGHERGRKGYTGSDHEPSWSDGSARSPKKVRAAMKAAGFVLIAVGVLVALFAPSG